MALTAKDKCNSATHQLKMVSPIAENKTKNAGAQRSVVFPAMNNGLQYTMFGIKRYSYSTYTLFHCQCALSVLMVRGIWKCGVQLAPPRVAFLPNASRRLGVCFVQESFSILVIFPLQIFSLLWTLLCCCKHCCQIANTDICWTCDYLVKTSKKSKREQCCTTWLQIATGWKLPSLIKAQFGTWQPCWCRFAQLAPAMIWLHRRMPEKTAIASTRHTTAVHSLGQRNPIVLSEPV